MKIKLSITALGATWVRARFKLAAALVIMLAISLASPATHADTKSSKSLRQKRTSASASLKGSSTSKASTKEAALVDDGKPGRYRRGKPSDRLTCYNADAHCYQTADEKELCAEIVAEADREHKAPQRMLDRCKGHPDQAGCEMACSKAFDDGFSQGVLGELAVRPLNGTGKSEIACGQYDNQASLSMTFDADVSKYSRQYYCCRAGMHAGTKALTQKVEAKLDPAGGKDLPNCRADRRSGSALGVDARDGVTQCEAMDHTSRVCMNTCYTLGFGEGFSDTVNKLSNNELRRRTRSLKSQCEDHGKYLPHDGSDPKATGNDVGVGK